MIYLTTQHTQPPEHVLHNDMLYPTAPLIAQSDTAMLAQLGIVPHHPLEPGIPYPLGKEWVEMDGEWFEETIGTEAEQQAALDAQAAAEREAYLDALQCTKLQGKLALIQAGLWDQYEAIISAMLPNMSPAQRVFVEDALVWKYRDPVLQAFVGALGMTEEQVVTLFETARVL